VLRGALPAVWAMRFSNNNAHALFVFLSEFDSEFQLTLGTPVDQNKFDDLYGFTFPIPLKAITTTF